MTNKLPLVYVAGPITIPDPIWNTHIATNVADRLYASKLCVPLIPHYNLMWHLICPHDTEYWYEYDMHILHRCDALLRIPGESVGAEAEILQANEWGIPVCYSEHELYTWCRQRDIILSHYTDEGD